MTTPILSRWRAAMRTRSMNDAERAATLAGIQKVAQQGWPPALGACPAGPGSWLVGPGTRSVTPGTRSGHPGAAGDAARGHSTVKSWSL